MKLLTPVFVAVLSFALNTVAQVETSSSPVREARSISGGVLNGKAVSLPKPAYPPAARAVNAEGAVSVQVLIGEDGRVESASAVSGHPLLRAAAVEAAKGAVFAPTLLSGTPVKVSGVIVYNFVGVTTLASIGYDIAYAEKTGAIWPYANANLLASKLPEIWTDERGILERLVFELPVTTDPPAAKAPGKPERNYDANKFTVVGSAAGTAGRISSGKLTPDSLDAIRRLQTSILTKLATEPRNEWHFRVGTALGVFAAEVLDDGKTGQNLTEIEFLARTAPSGINRSLIDGMYKLVDQARASDGTNESRQMLVSAAQNLKGIRIQ
ncbi:MAG TPA: energy transducer TonB [Pyrinomonadaceae bacterium]|nr:energy transducer TonB [Pyrinomonadaceae bacterium]